MMNKGDPQDIRDLADDLQGAIGRHPDAIRNNPDIANDLVRLRDKTNQRYREITEKPGAPPAKTEGWVG